MRPVHELIIVIPVYEDRQSLKQLLKHLATLDSIYLNLVIVDDGSCRSPPLIEDIENVGLSGAIIKLNSNRGHQSAIAIGLHYTQLALPKIPVLVMDADGEDKVGSIYQLVRRLENSTAAIVLAERSYQNHPKKYRFAYLCYKSLFKLLTGNDIKFGNFALLTNKAVRTLLKSPKLQIHFASSILASGLTLQFIGIERGRRNLGRSRMSFMQLILHGVRSMFIFYDTIKARTKNLYIKLFIAFLLMVVVTVIANQQTPQIFYWFLIPTILNFILLILIKITLLVILLVGQRCDKIMDQEFPKNILTTSGLKKQSAQKLKRI